MQVGATIREARLQKGLTQQELGDMLGVSKPTVAKWESGMTINIPRKHQAKLAEILGLSADYLIGTEPVDPEELAANLADYYRDRDLQEIAKLYRVLSPEHKRQALEYLRFLSKI